MSKLIPTSMREAIRYELDRYLGQTGFEVPEAERDDLADYLGDELYSGGWDIATYVEQGDRETAAVIDALRADRERILARFEAAADLLAQRETTRAARLLTQIITEERSK